MYRPIVLAALAGLFAVAVPVETARAADPYVVVVRPHYWWYRPYSYWSGVADVIDAQGRYLISEKQAKLLGEQVKQERLVTQRKKLEHWDWERKFVARSNEQYRMEVRAR